jgi:O-antigen/teichoic acid export membrane protein
MARQQPHLISPPPAEEPQLGRGGPEAPRDGRVVRDVLFQSGGRYLGAVLGIVRGLVIPKLLDPAMYGVFKSYQTLSELSRMATVGIPSALFRELPIAIDRKEKSRVERLLDNGFWSTVLSATPFAIALLVGGAMGWIRFEDVHLTAWHLLFVPLLFVDRTKIFFDVVFTGQKQFVFQAKLRMFDELATTILGVVGAWVFGFDGFLVAMVLANGLVTGIAWWGSGFQLRHAMDLPLAREMVLVGFPQLVVGLSNTVYSQLERMALVTAGFGMAAVGWYSVGMTICDQIGFGAQIVARVLMPRMMEVYGRHENIEDLRAFIIYPTRLAGLGYAGLIVAGAFASDVVFGAWLTKYAPGLVPTKIMLVGTYFLSVWVTVHPFFLAIKQQRYLLYCFLGTIPLAIVLFAVVIALGWGLPGVAVAAAVTDVGFAVSALWLALSFFMSRRDRVAEILRIFAPLPIAGALWAACEGVRYLAGLSGDKVYGGLLSLGVFCLIFGLATLFLLRSPFGRKAFGLDKLREIR